MCLKQCQKRDYQPRKSKEGPYIPTNAYSTPFSCEQIATFLLFTAQLVLYCVFVVPTLDDIREAILWVLLGFTFGLFLVIAYDYIYLTVSDPVDPLVRNEQLVHRYRQQDLTYCVICSRNVQVNSHHCLRCNRCTEEFDHHCKFLNNCIGGQNYQSFFRLLGIYSLYNLMLIGQSIWVLVENFQDKTIAFEGNQWGVLILLILTSLIELAVGALLIFHCYITLCENTTTLAYNYPERKENKDIKNFPKISINIFQAPASANRLNREDGKVVI